MTDEQAALMAANAKKYTITSHDAEVRTTLATADRFLAWLRERRSEQLQSNSQDQKHTLPPDYCAPCGVTH